jgi:hypothetical protein
MHDRYAERVAFYVVYIKEAHPEDGWVVTHNRDDGIRMDDPTTSGERSAAADACAVRAALRIPVLVDGLDNAVARAYGGWPDRLYLVGRGGRVVFQGGPGPFEFKPELLEAAIEDELTTN